MNPVAGLASETKAPPVWDERLDNFTRRAQQTLKFARMEADRLRHNFVGTEHLLLGLLRLGQGTGVDVLRKMDLSLEAVRDELENQMGHTPEQKMIGLIPYTPRAKKVLALAVKHAKVLKLPCVGTEHILLGLIEDDPGPATRAFSNLNFDVKRLRMEILRELDSRDSQAGTNSE
jgi:ATP-dependent Clp protease ATP-binding subunit ClpC